MDLFGMPLLSLISTLLLGSKCALVPEGRGESDTK